MAEPAGPGPLDRTTFFEEQARHRRRTLRFTVVSALAVLLTGIPVSLVVSPVLFLVTLTAAHLVELARPLPRGFWRLVDQAGQLAPTLVDQADRLSRTGNWGVIDIRAAVTLGLGAVVPGMVLTLLVWLWVRALLRKAGVGGVLARIDAREPRPHDLEERQLGNLVEEMAIAGGLRPPRLLLLDTDAPNAAAIGRGPEDAAIVVTRGLLERLDRDQTQGVIGHLVGSVGNGDLKIAWLLLSVFQTYSLLAILLHAPSAPVARRNAWRAFRGLFRRNRAELEQVAELLVADDDQRKVGEQSESRSPLAVLRLPLVLVALTVQMLTALGAMLVFGPALGALWRARRYLADATAVQLTRNPHGLANALHLLEGQGGFEQGQSSQLLFVVWDGIAHRSDTLGFTIPGGLHPKTRRRVKRLEAVGARLQRSPRASMRLPVRAPSWALRLAMPFIALLTALMYVVLAASVVFLIGLAIFLTLLSLLFTALGIGFVHWFFKVLPQLPAIARQVAELARELIAMLRASRAG
jgi:Zn-dependent protease with chaperone function